MYIVYSIYLGTKQIINKYIMDGLMLIIRDRTFMNKISFNVCLMHTKKKNEVQLRMQQEKYVTIYLYILLSQTPTIEFE